MLKLLRKAADGQREPAMGNLPAPAHAYVDLPEQHRSPARRIQRGGPSKSDPQQCTAGAELWSGYGKRVQLPEPDVLL
jgi:hypothetical protein